MVASYMKRAVREEDNYEAPSGKLRNGQGSGLVQSQRKKGVRKKKNLKLVKPLPKMKIVVKSTKTISFDEHSDEDDSSDHNDEEEGASQTEQAQLQQQESGEGEPLQLQEEGETQRRQGGELIPGATAPEEQVDLNASQPTSSASTSQNNRT